MSDEEWFRDNLISKLPASCLRIEAMNRFGDLDLCNVLADSSVLETISGTMLVNLAEEALLTISCNIEIPDHIYAILSDVSPFGEGYPPLRLLKEMRSAVAVFPLHGIAEPALAHIWLFHDDKDMLGSDQFSKMNGASEFHAANPDIKVFIFLPPHYSTQDILGRSWQLAYGLARVVIDDSDLKMELASNWLLTGSVNNSIVEKVKLGNKTALITNRNWLIPRDNHGDIPPSWNPRGKVLYTSSIEEAKDRIIGRVVKRSGKICWPGGVRRLCSFSSRAETTVVAAAILSGVDELVLFVSDNDEESYIPALNIKEFLEEHSVINVIIPDDRIPSDDVYAIEKYISTQMESVFTSGSSEKVIFHVTTGNKLMSFAVSNIARRNPYLWLVYRDRDKGDHEYTALFYDGLEPTTATLTSGKKPHNVKWPLLPENAGSENNIWKEELKQILKATTLEGFLNA